MPHFIYTEFPIGIWWTSGASGHLRSVFLFCFLLRNHTSVKSSSKEKERWGSYSGKPGVPCRALSEKTNYFWLR